MTRKYSIAAVLVLTLGARAWAQDQNKNEVVGSSAEASKTLESEGAAITPDERLAQGDAKSDGGDGNDAAATSPGFDRIHLNDGSVLTGRVVDMMGGELAIEKAFGVDEVVKVKWSEVQKIESAATHEFHFADGSVKSVRLDAVTLGDVKAINPPPKKPLSILGSLNAGVSINDGNTQTKAINVLGDLVASYEKHRLTFKAIANYGEASGGLTTARNVRGSVKYDYFVTDRLFAYASAYAEDDQFQDLNLRIALSAGPGYQFVKPGDFEGFFSKLDASGEAGLSFFSEDHITGPDQEYLAARWAFRLDMPLNDRVALFHNHEGYPGLEDLSDLYITSSTGIRFTILGNFVGTLQVNWRWDNTPTPGFERSDVLYLATLGYQFRL